MAPPRVANLPSRKSARLQSKAGSAKDNPLQRKSDAPAGPSAARSAPASRNLSRVPEQVPISVPVEVESSLRKLTLRVDEIVSNNDDLNRQIDTQDARLMVVEDDIRQLRSDMDQVLRWMRESQRAKAADNRDIVERTPSKANQSPRQIGSTSPINTKRVIEETVEQTIRILSTPGTIPQAADQPLATEPAPANTLEQTSAKAVGPMTQKPEGDKPQTGQVERDSKRKHSRRSRRDSSSSSSDSSDSDSDSYNSSSDSDRQSRKRHIGHGNLRKGKPYRGLKRLKATNVLYDKLLDYRYYRLKRTSRKRSSRETGKVKEYVKRIEYTLKEFRFDGTDPIKILAFLAKYVEEADILRMSEAQAFIALPKVLSGHAQEQFNAVRGASVEEGGVSCRPEAVQYLLRSYATSANINEAIARLRSTIQRADETEMQYSSRLNNAFVRCGNVYSLSEKIQFFVDGLDPAIKSLVSRHREADRRCTFLELVQFAQAEGDAIRARERRRSSRLQVSPAKRTHPQRALFAEEKQHLHHSSAETTEQYSATDKDVENLNLVGDYGSSVPTSDLPTSSGSSHSTNPSDPALAIGYGKQYRQSGSRSGSMPAPRVPYQEASPGMAQQRPGWVNREEQVAQRTNPS